MYAAIYPFDVYKLVLVLQHVDVSLHFCKGMAQHSTRIHSMCCKNNFKFCLYYT